MSRPLGAALCAALTTVSPPAAAAGYTPWGAATSPGTVSLSPYLTVGSDGTTSISPYAFFGAHDHLDVMFGYTLALGPSTEAPAVRTGALELMPRVVVHEAFTLAPHLLYVPGETAATLALEVHGTTQRGGLAFTYNAGVRSVVDARGLAPQQVFLTLAPEVKVAARVSLFTEINPAISLPMSGSVGWSVQVVPGLTVQVDAHGRHLLTTALPVNVAGEGTTASAGLLYSGSFNLRPGGRRAAPPQEP